VISTRQTCGQRSGMAAGSKRRVLAFSFSIRICYMFLISKCREKSDLGLCMTFFYLQKECRCAVPTSDESCGQTHLKIGSRHCALTFCLQVLKSCTDLDPTFLYISKPGTYSKFVRKNKMLALGVCFPQPCPSAGCRFAVSRPDLNYY